MQRCWEVPELTSMIFEHLEDDEMSRDACLYRVAQTCHRFSAVVLPLLWEAQVGLTRLLRCLPPHTWEISEGTFKIRCPLKVEDWDRVLVYSRFIRNYNDVPAIYDMPLDCSVLPSVVGSLPIVPIFPNLRVLSSECGGPLLPYLRYLMGPRVTQLTIEVVPGDICTFSALSFLGSTCPSVRELQLWDMGRLDDVGGRDSMSILVTKLFLLQKLRAISLDTRAYQHISRLRSLESLAVRYLDTIPFPSGSPSSGSFFPGLRDLQLRSQSINFCTNFMSRTCDAPLGQVYVTAPAGTAADLLALFSTFSAPRRSPLDLTSIKVRISNGAAHTGLYTLSADAIQPLFGFPNLRHVALTTPPFDLDAEFVTKMALAWPDIEHLQMATSRPTILSLHAFSRHCPHLHHLHFAVDATDAQMVHPPISPRVIQTALETIHVGDSPIGSPVQVAQLLSSIFPSLRRITGPGSLNGGTNSPWNEVGRLVPILVAARADERRILTAGSESDIVA
ncbi:hypothetical protein DFH06DRAFT_1480658 [Mycena polygramma]|nr:hypothetical protein DFH06DRAFT_1480658 [Mycena polygramma]